MATAPSEISTVTDYSAAQTSIWRRIAARPYAPETLLLYSALSFFFLGRNLIGHFSDRYIGMGQDPAAYMLFFEWWRYALANHLNPFNMTAVWYPSGFNLAWTPSAPLAALAMLPIEASVGPVVAYNFAILLWPALSAWSAFLLCRYIARSYWPSLMGGYIFGFSSYMLCHSLGHVDLTMVFLLPAAAHLVLKFFAKELNDLRFILLFTLVLLGQFLSTPEILAAFTLMGSSFLLLTWCFSGESVRRRILTLVPRLAISSAALAVLISPYLYYFFRDGAPPMANAWATAVSAQPLGLFVPVSTNVFGGWGIFRIIAPASSLWETGEYIGIPLFLVLWHFARTRRNEPAVKILTVFFALACLATFDSYLMAGSKRICPLPWLLVAHLPLLHMVLPARLSVYIFLDLAVVAAIWLASPRNSSRLRIGAGVAIIVSLLPNLSASYWTLNANTPPFFKDGIFQKYLSPKETALILPYGYGGDSDAWLAEARMHFRMAGGYVGVIPPVPPGFDQYPIVASFYNLVDIPDADEQLKCFLVQKHVGAVIVADEGEHLYQPVPNDPIYSLYRVSFSPQQKQTIQALFARLGVAPVHVGGVSLYRVPLGDLQPYATIRPDLLQKRIAAIRFATLVMAANRYLAHRYDPKALTPLRAQQLGLLPARWVGGVYELPQFRQRPIQDELLLSGAYGGKVGVGILGPRDVLERLARDYTRFAALPAAASAKGYRAGNGWLFPPGLHSPSAADATEWVLLLEFQPDGLAQAAQAAERVLAEQAAHHI